MTHSLTQRVALLAAISQLSRSTATIPLVPYFVVAAQTDPDQRHYWRLYPQQLQPLPIWATSDGGSVNM